MTTEYIKDIISLESLHRYCFDKLYVQNYEITREDLAILYRYKMLCKKYPTFRQDCWDIFIYLSNKEKTSEEIFSQLILSIYLHNDFHYSILCV